MRIKQLIALICAALSFPAFSVVPILNSKSTITNKVIYLDFDGEIVSSSLWDSGSTINALPSTLSPSDIILVWKRVSEDFIPFDVNITTDVTRFNQAPANARMRIIITPTSAWYGGAGGVAYLDSFNWGGTPGTPCWVFEDQLGYNTKYTAEACSHEAGHTLSLSHQSTYTNTPPCTQVDEYNPGQGSGVTSWAPIMGVGYYENVTTWFNGQSSDGCNVIQFDHGNSSPGITSPGFLSFSADDVGNSYLAGKTLTLNTIAVIDSGIITTPMDVDVYKFTICNDRYVSIAVKPWALDTVNYSDADLDIRFQLFNASTNSLLATDAPLNKLNTLVGFSLSAGSYYFIIDGDGSANYTDYGSLGRYYITIKTTNAPLITNTIVTNPTICQGHATTLSYVSNGVPNNFKWQITGPSSSSSTAQYPSVIFPSSGIYTISLLAMNNFYSCPVTKTINVNPSPSLSVPPSVLICHGSEVSLTVSGATNYTWMPGNLQGSSQTLTPQANTNYTITGSNGICTNTIVTAVSISPDFILQLSASDTLFCVGDTISLYVSGADTYTFNPGSISGNLVYVMPVASTVYTVTGANADACIHERSINLIMEECNYTGISVHSSEDQFRIYPNPNNGDFFIETISYAKIIIHDCLGQLVLSSFLQTGKNNFNMTELANGFYFIRIENKQANTILKILKN